MRATAAPAAGWRALALPLVVTVVVQICQNIALLSVAVLAPVIAPALGVPVGLSGVFIGLAYLTGAVTSSQAGRLLASTGPMTASLLALVCDIAGLVLAAVGGLSGFAAAAALIGFAYGLTTPTSSEILVATTPRSLYGRVFSIKQAAVPAGGLLAGLVAPPLAAVFGWQGALLALALVVGVAFIAFLPFRARFDAVRRARTTPPVSPLGLVLATPRLRRLVLAGFCLSGAQLTVSTFFTAHLVAEIGLELVLAGVVYALVQAMGVPGRVVWGAAADRSLGIARSLRLLACLTVVSLVLTASAGAGWPLAALVGLAVVLGLTTMSWTGLLVAAAVAARPEEASAASAGAMIFTFAGVVTVPPLVGLVVAATASYALGFAIAAVVAAAAAALLLTAPADDV